MGILTEGAIVSEVRGSVGDRTFSKNAYGPYVKRKLVQTVTNTPEQQESRSVFANAVSVWQSLPQSQRNDWMNWAKERPMINTLGKKMRLSGYNLFISSYINKALIVAFGVQPIFRLSTFPKIGENSITAPFGELLWDYETQFPNNDYHWAFYVSPQYNFNNTAVNPSKLRFAIHLPAAFNAQIDFEYYNNELGFPTFVVSPNLCSWLGVRLIHRSTGWSSKMYLYKLQSVPGGQIS